MDFKNIFKVWGKVFKNWRYIILTFFVAFSFYSLNAIIGNWKVLISTYPSLGFLGVAKLFFIFLIGFGKTVKLHSYISLIIISVFFGLLFSLVTYKTVKIRTTTGKVGLLTSIGIFIGILAPGCAACGVGLLSVFGISAAFLTFLPYEGLELSILSIGILSFSVFKISESIGKGESCKVNVKTIDHFDNNVGRFIKISNESSLKKDDIVKGMINNERRLFKK
jgi:hypothetical protein